MPNLTYAALLNEYTSSRPTDRDINSDLTASSTMGNFVANDIGVPVPSTCTTPEKLLHWILERIIAEQAIADSGSATIVSRSRALTASDGTLRNTYTVNLSLDISDALDEDDISEATFTEAS